MEKKHLFGAIAGAFGLIGFFLILFAEDYNLRTWTYLIAVFLVAFFTWSAAKKGMQEEFQGKPIEELPDLRKFRKLSEYRGSGTSTFLLLHNMQSNTIKFYLLEKNSLVDRDKKVLSELPKEFNVRKGTVGEIIKTDRVNERGETRSVYYIFPEQEDK